MSKKPKTTEEAFTPEQLDKLETKGDKQVLNERRKEGVFQRYHAARDSKDLAKQVKWKRRAGIALIILLLVLLLLWIISWLMSTIGDLVISVDSGAVKKGIVVSEDADGNDPKTELSADMVGEVTNITYDWLPATLDMEAEGTHNGRNYLAYTFYLRNQSSSITNPTKEPVKVQSTLRAVRAAKSADEAVRVMIYRNGEPTVYGKKNISVYGPDGKPVVDRDADESKIIPLETLKKKVIPEDYEAPSADQLIKNAEAAQNKEPIPTTDEEIPVVEFVDDEIVFDMEEEEMQPGDVIKYTVVVWIEGNDPECIDEIRGGFVKLNWFFNIADEEL